jgi:hypothetical protein
MKLELGKWYKLNTAAFDPPTCIMPVQGGYLISVWNQQVLFVQDGMHATWSHPISNQATTADVAKAQAKEETSK